jgi:hypothetical protein
MDLVFDEGLALFAGLNVAPKTTYLDTYSHTSARARTDPPVLSKNDPGGL